MLKINTKKKDLIEKIYNEIGFSKIICKNLTNDIIKLLILNFKDYDYVKIKNFGTFSKKHKKERIGRNPKTKETKIISSRSVITFKPSKSFLNKINSLNEKK